MKRFTPDDHRTTADGTGRVPARSHRRRLIAVTAAIALGAGTPTLIIHLFGPGHEDGTPQVTAPPTPITYWPDASTTGVPPGAPLRASGGLTLRTAGQVVSNLDITGCVRVHASNVRILRSRIRCDSTAYGIFTVSGARNLVIEDVEINGMGRVSVGVCCAYYTMRRVNIHNSVDGARLGNSTTIVDSYIHSLARPPGSHTDTLQSTGGVGILVQRNSLQPYNPLTGDLANACLMLGSEQAPAVQNLSVVDNYCNGGNWSIGVRSDLVASNVLFRANRFGRNYRYGVIARPRHPGLAWESNNVWFDNGLRVIP